MKGQEIHHTKTRTIDGAAKQESYYVADMSWDDEPVIMITFSASSRMVNSPGLPRLTGPRKPSALFIMRIMPSTSWVQASRGRGMAENHVWQARKNGVNGVGWDGWGWTVGEEEGGRRRVHAGGAMFSSQ